MLTKQLARLRQPKTTHIEFNYVTTLTISGPVLQFSHDDDSTLLLLKSHAEECEKKCASLACRLTLRRKHAWWSSETWRAEAISALQDCFGHRMAIATTVVWS